jgi:hypothetical protein
MSGFHHPLRWDIAAQKLSHGGYIPELCLELRWISGGLDVDLMVGRSGENNI